MKKDNAGNSMTEFMDKAGGLPDINKRGKRYPFG